jgi:cell wall-associated NlpC family hydrolase
MEAFVFSEEGVDRIAQTAQSLSRRPIPFVWVIVFSMTILGGCSSSSPRFRSPGETGEGITDGANEVRFASKIKEEEAREDDKKVDIQSAKKKFRSSKNEANSLATTTPSGVNRDLVLLEVISYLGVPYEYGGVSKGGMDCSGFASTVYAKAVNTTLPRQTREQFRLGTAVMKHDLQFGDLVFFNTTGHNPSHVGIYIEDDLFAHASVTSGVTISSLESTYYKRRFIGARRIVN